MEGRRKGGALKGTCDSQVRGRVGVKKKGG